MTSTELSTQRATFNDADLGAIKSFEDAASLLRGYAESVGVNVESADDYGTGFRVVENKDSLVGVEMIFLDWRFTDGDFGQFVSIEAVTKAGDKFIINDGSTGLYQQMVNITAQRAAAGRPDTQTGLYVPHGLTKTDYFFNEDTKETASRKPENGGKAWKPASTYYVTN